MKKARILLVVDKPGWAYDQMANFIISELGDKYEFYKDYRIIQRLTFNPRTNFYYLRFWLKRMLQRKIVRSAKYDIVCFLWWRSVKLFSNLNSSKRLVGVFTEGFPPGGNKEFEFLDPRNFLHSILDKPDGIVAGNKNIQGCYANLGIPVYYATGGVDINLFREKRRPSKRDETLNVCWTGNPNRSFKGFYEFVKPAVELAITQRSNIRLITRFEGPLETLPDFYSRVDVMINASDGDAGPGFLVDAGACGVPTISTNTGLASEIIRDYENGLLVDRNVESIAQKIVEICDNRALLEKMSENIYRDVHEHWGYSSRAKYWDEMFMKVLEG